MSSTAFIEPLPVIDFVAQLLNRSVSIRPLSDADRVKIKKALRGVKVEVTHRGNMRRKYRIFGLTSQATRELTFPIDDHGTVKTVIQYFQETYGFNIQHTTLPCLQVGNPQKPNYLPMEVCKIIEGQRYSKRLNEKQITALLKVTCQRPQQRELDILQVIWPHFVVCINFNLLISSLLVFCEFIVLFLPSSTTGFSHTYLQLCMQAPSNFLNLFIYSIVLGFPFLNTNLDLFKDAPKLNKLNWRFRS
jgi:hypothetical protein